MTNHNPAYEQWLHDHADDPNMWAVNACEYAAEALDAADAALTDLAEQIDRVNGTGVVNADEIEAAQALAAGAAHRIRELSDIVDDWAHHHHPTNNQ